MGSDNKVGNRFFTLLDPFPSFHLDLSKQPKDLLVLDDNFVSKYMPWDLLRSFPKKVTITDGDGLEYPMELARIRGKVVLQKGWRAFKEAYFHGSRKSASFFWDGADCFIARVYSKADRYMEKDFSELQEIPSEQLFSPPLRSKHSGVFELKMSKYRCRRKGTVTVKKEIAEMLPSQTSVMTFNGIYGQRWEVTYIVTCHRRIFAKGWDVFARMHNLREGDTVKFSVDGKIVSLISICRGNESQQI